MEPQLRRLTATFPHISPQAGRQADQEREQAVIDQLLRVEQPLGGVRPGGGGQKNCHFSCECEGLRWGLLSLPLMEPLVPRYSRSNKTTFAAFVFFLQPLNRNVLTLISGAKTTSLGVSAPVPLASRRPSDNSKRPLTHLKCD